ncbi:MAG: TonB-dependent siderophore receptor [Comamonas sp.]|nr:TonB-dependent siderophore receptor [Candidatus Comamonas equi]
MSNALKTSNKPGVHSELSPLQMALAAGLCIAGASAFAQNTATLSTVTVTDTAASAVKVDSAPSAKFTAPLIDTPKTVTVINEEVLQQTGATSLQEALKATPGITFGNGEGGNPSGDQPFIRGADAQSSTFVDGMRDIAAGSREAFNLESVEVIKGADSAYSGRGGAGGSINLTTKKAQADNFITGDVGLGTDNYRRATLDLNRKLGETTGFRLNAMAHDADVAGRKGPTNQRWGIAPTVTFGMGTPTEVTLSWQHLKTDNIPDGGVPYLYSNSAMAGLPGGSTVRPTYGNHRENWYGLTDRDFEKETSDLFTASVEHKFTEHNKFRNSLRYSKSEQDYLWTQPDDSKGNVLNGYVWRRGNARQAEVTTVQNLSEFSGKAQAGVIEHRYALGLELSKEKSDVRAAAVQSGGNCSAVSLWCASLNHPNSGQAWTGTTTLPAQATLNQIDTIALYGFDTLKLNEQWLLNAGLRADHYKLKASGPAGGRAPNTYPAYDLSRSDTLLNYQLGVVYKPASNGSIYASLGTSSRPGGSTLGNGNEDLTTNTQSQAELNPEKTRSMELGTKWDLLNKKLGVNAALFRNEVTNVRITENGDTFMGGNKVVNGVELGFSGQVARGLNVFGGYTYMDSEQKNMGAGNIANGLPFANTPKHSFSLWTSYKPVQQLTLGLGVYAQSSVAQGYAKSTVDGGLVTKGVSGYTRLDAMASYQFNPNLALQLNLYNLTDKVYYSGVRSPHYANMGAGRSAVAALKFTY